MLKNFWLAPFFFVFHEPGKKELFLCWGPNSSQVSCPLVLKLESISLDYVSSRGQKSKWKEWQVCGKTNPNLRRAWRVCKDNFLGLEFDLRWICLRDCNFVQCAKTIREMPRSVSISNSPTKSSSQSPPHPSPYPTPAPKNPPPPKKTRHICGRCARLKSTGPSFCNLFIVNGKPM